LAHFHALFQPRGPLALVLEKVFAEFEIGQLALVAPGLYFDGVLTNIGRGFGLLQNHTEVLDAFPPCVEETNLFLAYHRFFRPGHQF